ncbi:MAG: tRNA (adenosine(37)-N6)-threonylcarbamoyltransferase complex dimerization subunit type 1 TsaB [Clostridia bacterium]|nr:tRNA (adenosine(37)-N6)-threonylcarbamoyltransferase complex dimerization subunit type 1 TsaB [Clostridia bacterium]
MKILSIDTSSNVCGVSILENHKLICNLDCDTGRTHSENLMPMIKDALSKANLTLNEIGLIVCDIGPGSFTGIRIGIATVKAFNDSLNIPCIGVSSLEALAYNINNNSALVCSILDCKNDNCYFALYEMKEKGFETLIEPQSEDINSTLSILKSYINDNFENAHISFVGDGSKIYQNQIKETFKEAQIADENQDILNSYNLGICGYEKFINGEHLNEEILPLYLKKPQAQRLLEEKMKGTSNNE